MNIPRPAGVALHLCTRVLARGPFPASFTAAHPLAQSETCSNTLLEEPPKMEKAASAPTNSRSVMILT